MGEDLTKTVWQSFLHLAGNATHEGPLSINCSRLLSSWEESFAGLVTFVTVHSLLSLASVLNVVSLFPLSRMECLHDGGSR